MHDIYCRKLVCSKEANKVPKQSKISEINPFFTPVHCNEIETRQTAGRMNSLLLSLSFDLEKMFSLHPTPINQYVSLILIIKNSQSLINGN